jgi:type IX secretion system PorP/SprF family membrane protein
MAGLYPKKFCLWLLLLSICGDNYTCQQSILLNQSPYNLFILNPAAAGLNKEITANCHYKKNWLGLSESPELMQLTVDGAFSKNKFGFGINIANEKAGIFSKTYLSAALRYRVKLSANHHLLFGLSGGFQRQLSNFSQLKADAPEEFAQWPQQQAATIADAACGIIYNYKKLYVTASANQLPGQNYLYREPVYNKDLQYKTIPHFIFSAQNTFILKPDKWAFMPHVTIRSPQGLPVQIDLVNTIIYKNKILAGIGYRYFYAFYTSFGFCITDKLRLIYSYEYSYGIQNLAKGGHEIGLSFGLVNSPAKPNKSDNDATHREVDEIFEKLDKYDRQIEVLNSRTDSLDKNLAILKTEVELLKSRQVSQEEIVKAIDSYFNAEENKNKISAKKANETGSTEGNKVDKPGKYKVISPKSENEFDAPEDAINANYKIVMGVYQLDGYAREYQKFLKREMAFGTKLIQLTDHPKKYIYVCLVKEYRSLKEALKELRSVRKLVRSKTIEITRGEAWVLQTLTD